MKILVAGIGNIFFGDDAFGCDVICELGGHKFPENVRVHDYGIRSYDLAYAIMDHEVSILVDALPRGGAPGTLYLLEPDITELDEAPNEPVNAHSMNPVRVLQMVRSFGGTPRQLFVVGCEPEHLDSTGEFGLSDSVRSAIPGAIEMIQQVLGKLLPAENFSDAVHQLNPPRETQRII